MAQIPYAAARDWRLPGVPSHAPLDHLAAAWRRTSDTLREMTRQLERGDLHPAVRCIAVSGSLGRMEQIQHSDVDLVVFVSDEAGSTGHLPVEAYASVWNCLTPLGCERPKADGIFSKPHSAAQLDHDVDRGTIDEDMANFGIRMQLLLDCQPIWGELEFRRVQSRVLHYYAGNLGGNAARPWEFLLCDLIRYFRSMAVNAHWKLRDRPETWRLRNLKRFHSRRVMFAGLVLLLGQSEQLGDAARDWVLDRLSLTPLERLADVYAANGESGMSQVAQDYDRFLERLQDAEFRRRMADPVVDDEPERLPAYQLALEGARRIQSELTRFLLARQANWRPSFLEQLLVP